MDRGLLSLAIVLAVGCAAGARPSDGGPRTGPDGAIDCEELQLCGAHCADLETDPANCGQCDRTCVVPGAESACVAGECTVARCEIGMADCNASADDGCERVIDCTPGDACTTTCGSAGALACADACAPTCTPPAESCNAADDDCDGACEGGLPGCRRGVHRSGGPSHFYTTSLPEAGCCGFHVEAENYFFVYSDAADGLQPFFRCITGTGHHYYTTDTAADGLGGIESIMGFVARDARCGAVPLHRLRHSNGDHFYTTSAGERDSAVGLGYTYVGIAAFVWTAP